MAEGQVLEKNSKVDGLANAPLKKKIGFFSAMMVVVGSSVGAGIFFKAGNVLGDSQNSIIFAIFCWLFAAFAVIAMGLALIEIASARNDNLSLIGWCQTFNGRWIYKACKNFMVYIYLPLTYFFMPLYVVMSIQDGIMGLIPSWNGVFISQQLDWLVLTGIAVLMSVYFIVVCGLSSKAGNIQNWIITSVKFLPLIFAAVLGFVIFFMNGAKIASPDFNWGFVASPNTTPSEIYSFSSMTPGFGMFIAVAAIFFAYDGFYVAAGIQSEMKEPKKTPLAILFGLIIVTLIYLVIAVSMSLGSEDGSPFGFQTWLESKNLTWAYGTFQILIGVGVIGIINGFALWSTRFMEDLIRANEVPLSSKLINKINDKRPTVGIVYNLVLSIPIVVVFCVIGGLAYIDTGSYGYATSANKLYEFADLMGTWTALLAFAFITFAIAGALRNRRTNEIKVVKSKFFKGSAIITLALMSLPIFFTFFAPIADVFLLFRIPSNTEGFVNDILIPRIMTVVVLFIFIGLMIIPELLNKLSLKMKYGSVDQGLVEKAKKMAFIKNVSLESDIIESLAVEKRVKLENWEKIALGRDSLTEQEIAKVNGEIDSIESTFMNSKNENKDKGLFIANNSSKKYVYSGLSEKTDIDSANKWKL